MKVVGLQPFSMKAFGLRGARDFSAGEREERQDGSSLAGKFTSFNHQLPIQDIEP
jgi:hypothetical protein